MSPEGTVSVSDFAYFVSIDEVIDEDALTNFPQHFLDSAKRDGETIEVTCVPEITVTAPISVEVPTPEAIVRTTRARRTVVQAVKRREEKRKPGTAGVGQGGKQISLTRAMRKRNK